METEVTFLPSVEHVVCLLPSAATIQRIATVHNIKMVPNYRTHCLPRRTNTSQSRQSFQVQHERVNKDVGVPAT